MGGGSRGLALATGMLMAMTGLACSNGAPDASKAAFRSVDSGVPETLAEQRSRTIRDLHYEISLAIPESREAAITGRIEASFELTEPGAPLVFDFAHAADRVHEVTLGDSPVAHTVENEHIVIPSTELQAGRQEVAIDFVAGDGSLNRNDDYLYTLFVPDRARVAIPVFDQPDLKARCTLHLEVPATWQAIANGELTGQEEAEDRRTFHFELTDPIPTYLLAFAAGRFETVTADRDGRTYTLLHRETDDEKVARNLDAIFDLHHDSVLWLEEYTAIPYPFQKFGLVAVPAFQYGGMEHPGAIFYRARTLFLDESATQSELLGRASLIAHETAHMWFGNLVTMEWFDDVWMKEVMANFMAAKIVNPSFPEVDHELRFLLAHYPRAYEVDRTAGANPIRQPLDNLDEAGSLYGAIIYQKAPIAMRHLELRLGQETFRDGIRQYLDAHRYGNASWPDLITVLDATTDQDLAAWSQTWVNEAGRPTIEVDIESEDGTVASLAVRQSDPQNQGRVWPQPLQVLLGYGRKDGQTAPRSLAVDLDQARAEATEAIGLPAPDFVLANSEGVAYGHFVLDDASRKYLLTRLPNLPTALLRAVAWLSLWDSMLSAETRAEDFVDLAEVALERETDELNIQRFLDDLVEAFWRYLPPETREDRASDLESLLWRKLQGAPEARLKAAYFGAFRELASSDGALARLRRILRDEETLEDLPLSEIDRTEIAQELAVRGVADAESLLDEQAARISNPDRQARFEFIRPALSADPATRTRFFESLRDASRREQERWVLDALRFLHHPLRTESSEPLILPSLEMIEEIQRTGDIFFPLGWLQATLSGHRSASAAAVVRRFLEETPDLPPRLRGKLLQAADPLFRAAEIPN